MWFPSNASHARTNLIVVISAFLFLVFDGTVLGLSYWIAKQVEKDAVAINIAGRQRMLSQRMTKSLLQLHVLEGVSGRGYPFEELRVASTVFDTTLRAFAAGGRVDAADGRRVYQEALKGQEGRQLVERAMLEWQPIQQSIAELFDADEVAVSASLNRAVEVAAARNLTLLDYSNRITNYIESESRGKTENLRVLQVAAFAMALSNFVVMLGALWRRMQLLHGRQEQLRQQAEHDVLTGLPNRKMLLVGLKGAVERMLARESGLVVAFLDLNNFKPVNDLHGHAAGDHVLQVAAKRLRARLRHSDLIARHGGDEFVVVLEDLGSIDQAKPVLDGLIEAMAEPIEVSEGIEVQVGLSIGAVYLEGEAATPDQLLHASDQLMYQVKRGKGRRWEIGRLDSDGHLIPMD